MRVVASSQGQDWRVQVKDEAKEPPTGKRGKIVGWSGRSRARARWKSRGLRSMTHFVTLTYPGQFSSDGQEVKSHLNHFLVSVRRRYPGVRYFWVLEFQARGAPHFHILLDRDLPVVWLSARWYTVVGSWDERHLAAGTGIEPIRDRAKCAAYVGSYATKYQQKEVPEQYNDVGRFWGCSRGLVANYVYEVDLGFVAVLKSYLRRKWGYLALGGSFIALMRDDDAIEVWKEWRGYNDDDSDSGVSSAVGDGAGGSGQDRLRYSRGSTGRYLVAECVECRSCTKVCSWAGCDTGVRHHGGEVQ